MSGARLASAALAGCLSLVCAPHARPQPGGELCPPLPAAVPLAPADADARTHLSADRLVGAGEGRTEVSGNVLLTQPGKQISAERLLLDERNGHAEAEGNVRYELPDLTLSGERAELELNGDSAVLEQAGYLQRSTGMRGTAQRLETRGEQTTLHAATLSSCPPEQQDWVLEVDRVELDQHTQQGTAHGTLLRFKGVPLLYSPWFRFPIGDARQSGFLPPSLGLSDSSGTELSIPWYWNIAPQADATFTVHNMTERGTQLQNELRLLTGTGRWQLNADYLDDHKFGEPRSFAHLTHSGRPGASWATYIDAADASDADYFDDLGDSLSIASVTHLQRRAELRYYGTAAQVTTTLLSYQTLDETLAPAARPYQMLPRIALLSYAPERADLDYGIAAELVRFERQDSLTGQRLDLRPRLGLPLGGASWYLTPAAELRYTEYALDNPGAGQRAALTRTLPVLSVDGGLFFERRAGQRLQTLEPRAFYLYVPFEDQSELPVFDTGEYTFSFAQLFRDNRFTGADRVGDAQQLSLALSTRLLDPATGSETFSAGIGQIYYFRDREVTLPGATADTRPSSDAIAEAALALNDTWRVGAALQYNPDIDANERSVLQLQYRGGERGSLANFAYRYRRDLQQQADWSFRWRVGPRWSLLGRWLHELEDDRVLEALAGFEYESCCWLLRSVARERVRDDGAELEHSLYLQLVLKGLSDIGSPAGALFEHGILGYREAEY